MITTAQTSRLCNRKTCCCGRQKFGLFYVKPKSLLKVYSRLNRPAFYRSKHGTNRNIFLCYDCSRLQSRRRSVPTSCSQTQNGDMGEINSYSTCPLTTHAKELQKGCYCRSVSAIHQGSPLILDLKAAFKEWTTLFGRRELHVLKYWSPDAQLEAVEQRLRHFVAARRNTSDSNLFNEDEN